MLMGYFDLDGPSQPFLYSDLAAWGPDCQLLCQEKEGRLGNLGNIPGIGKMRYFPGLGCHTPHRTSLAMPEVLAWTASIGNVLESDHWDGSPY